MDLKSLLKSLLRGVSLTMGWRCALRQLGWRCALRLIFRQVDIA